MVSWLSGLFKREKIESECREIRELSSGYLDGDIDRTMIDRVASHLDKCPPCRAFVNTLKRTIDLMRGIPKQEAPEGFRQQVLESLKAQRLDNRSA